MHWIARELKVVAALLVVCVAGAAALRGRIRRWGRTWPGSDAGRAQRAGEGFEGLLGRRGLHTIDPHGGRHGPDRDGDLPEQGERRLGIRVAFDKKEVDRGTARRSRQKQRLDYVLDEGWLTDRDYQKKLEVRRQVLRPGQKMNLLKLGEGPFPLPIGQDKEEVKRQFDATKEPLGVDDPKGTVARLAWRRRRGRSSRSGFSRSTCSSTPGRECRRRIDTVERAGTTRSTDLTNVKLNSGVKDDAFVLPKIDEPGWNRREEPFE